MITALYIVVALGLVALNAFFVATEFAIVRVRRTRVQELVDRGISRASAVRLLLDDLNPYLSACQLGITLASLGLGWIGEPAFARLIEPLFAGLGRLQGAASHSVAVVVAFVLITFLHVVLGELVPKTVAIDYPLRTSLLIAWPIRWFYVAFYPAIWAMNEMANVVVRLMGLQPVAEEGRAHSGEELRMIVAGSRRGGVLSEVHARLLARALDFPDHTVRQVMLPRGDVVYLDLDWSFDRNLRIARESGYTRFPLCEGGLDQVVGVIHIKGVFAQGAANGSTAQLKALAREPLVVPETLPIERLLKRIQRRRVHLAIVIDEHGGTVGIVTLEDVLEELIGEIQDEYDQEEPKVVELADGQLSVDAALPLDELRDSIGLQPPDDEQVDTLGGMVFTRLGRVARVGDVVEIAGLRVEVSRTRGRRILRLLVHANHSQKETS